MKLPNFDTLAQLADSSGFPTSRASMFFDTVQKWLRWAASNLVAGAPSLTNPGAIPKVADAGVLAESALTDTGDAIVNKRSVSGVTQPNYVIDSGGTTPKSRVGRVADAARMDLTVNLYSDGANWYLDDTSQQGLLIYVNPGGFQVYHAPAAANPASLSLILDLDASGNVTAANNVNAGATGVFKVNGTQVVGARLATVAAPSGGVTVDVPARNAINALINRMQAHGLIS